MIFNISFGKYLYLTMLLFVLGKAIIAQDAKDIVNGNLIQFNDNGLWCWFQDERAIVDIANHKIIVGSDASAAGVGNSVRDGAIEAVIFDYQTGVSERFQLGKMSPDDHNAPAFIIRPDGKYLAMYSAHYDYYKNRYKIFDAGEWSAEMAYDWETRPAGTDYTIAYNNLYYLSTEGRMYDFSRANHRSPNFIISDDMGDTWTFGGQLTTNTSDSYNKGYYKYWSNGIDRIDFLFTEQHPRDTLTSIYHGYIKEGKTFDSYGNLVDDDILDGSFISAFWDYTKVFSNGTVMGNTTLYRCWQADLVRYNDGIIAAIVTARSNQFESFGYPDDNVNPEHDFIYCRFDGDSWQYSYLGKAGLKFYSSEADYVGLGALHPNDPNTLYISTPYDPRDTSISFNSREIFKGTTSDDGVTWAWFPITQNSVRDNIRPIVPDWDSNYTALLWCRGSYITAQSFDAAVVGIIDSITESSCKKIYVDANASNTTFIDGTELTLTGPDDNAAASDNIWHVRTGIGNENNVMTSAELRSGENSPIIKTMIDLPDDGTYDVWVNYWGYPVNFAAWRVKAGLDLENMKLFRSMASQQVDVGDYVDVPVISGINDSFLYQAYLGRVSGESSFEVFVDDSSYQVGTSNPIMQGDINRTWYDGISFAKVGEDVVNIFENVLFPSEYNLSQNYPNPFNPSTIIEFSLPVEQFVTLKIYNVIGEEINTLINNDVSAGFHAIKWNVQNLASGVYIYRLVTDNFSRSRKMVYQK